MSNKDFIFLNVPGLLSRYGAASDGNPDEYHRNLILAYTGTQLKFFQKEGLLLKNLEAVELPVNEVVLKFSNFTEEGQKFIMSGATDKWLQSCDKKGDLAAYQDSSGLHKRLAKFRATAR